MHSVINQLVIFFSGYLPTLVSSVIITDVLPLQTRLSLSVQNCSFDHSQTFYLYFLHSFLCFALFPQCFLALNSFFRLHIHYCRCHFHFTNRYLVRLSGNVCRLTEIVGGAFNHTFILSALLKDSLLTENEMRYFLVLEQH